MKKNQQVCISATKIKMLLLSLLVSFPLTAKIEVPEILEKGQLEKALPLMQEVASRYERARKNYNEKGPEAFIHSLSEKIPEADKKEILQLLARLPELPRISIQQDNLIFEFEDSKTLQFKVAEVVLGRFQSENFSKRYNFNSSPKENWESLRAKDKKNVSLFRLLDTYLLPMSYASTRNGRDIGIVTLGSLTQAIVLPKLGYVNYSPNGQQNH